MNELENVKLLSSIINNSEQIDNTSHEISKNKKPTKKKITNKNTRLKKNINVETHDMNSDNNKFGHNTELTEINSDKEKMIESKKQMKLKNNKKQPKK